MPTTTTINLLRFGDGTEAGRTQVPLPSAAASFGRLFSRGTALEAARRIALPPAGARRLPRCA